MRALILSLSAIAFLAAGNPAAVAKARAGNEKMKACATQWDAMKHAGQTKGMKYREFSKQCLSGGGTATAQAAAPAQPTPAPTAPAPRTRARRVASGPAAASAPAAANDNAGAPTGATAKCRDGTFSMSKHHSGSCSHHGGVANWLG